MIEVLEHFVLSIVRSFCVAQKQKGVADAMIEARLRSQETGGAFTKQTSRSEQKEEE
jgi:hypothetical protein